MANDRKKKQETFERKWASIVKKTASDQVLKQRLLQNPGQVLKDHGIEVPFDITIKIVENTPTTHYLVLPEPEVVGELSEEELRKVSGGIMQATIPGTLAPNALRGYMAKFYEQEKP